MIENATARLATEKADFRPALLSRPYAGFSPERTMAVKRKGISKRVRFEVFKRDSFKCQYCGKAAPDVILHVDHLSPVSKGGGADILNLITSCVDCNAGKSDVLLSDQSAIEKQRRQLEELNERREQLEMMISWRDGMAEINEKTLSVIEDAWRTAAPGYSLNESGIKAARKHLRAHGLQAVLDAIERAAEQYVRLGADGKATKESTEDAWKKVGGILRVLAMPADKRKLLYIKGIVRNRFNWNYEAKDMLWLEDAVQSGVDVEYIQKLAVSARGIRQFEEWLTEAIEEARGNGKGT